MQPNANKATPLYRATPDQASQFGHPFGERLSENLPRCCKTGAGGSYQRVQERKSGHPMKRGTNMTASDKRKLVEVDRCIDQFPESLTPAVIRAYRKLLLMYVAEASAAMLQKRCLKRTYS